MNKLKTLTLAFLVSSLALGSCVDDTESKSVTDIRTAKASQLTALANLANAQAEAALINAKADAMVKEASAASQNQTTAENKQKFEIALEQLKAEAAAAVLDAKQRALDLEHTMKLNTEAHIQSLFSNFQNANSTLTGLNTNLFTAQVSLIGLEATLVDWKVQKSQDILSANNLIAAQESTIKGLKALPANDKAAAKDAAELNAKALLGIKDRVQVLNDAYSRANIAYNAKIEALNKTKTAVAVDYLMPIGDFVGSDEITPKDANGNFASMSYDVYTIKDKSIAARIIRIQESIITSKKHIGKADGSEAGTLNANLKDAKTVEAAAKTQAELANATPQDREAYAQAQEATQIKQAALDTEVARQATFTEDIAKITNAQATFAGDDLVAYKAAIAAVEAAAAIEIAANVAMIPVLAEQTANETLQDALDILAGGLTDIPTAIKSAEVAISAQNVIIAKAEAISDNDEAVATKKETIANLKVEIASQSAIVANFKAQLDAELTK